MSASSEADNMPPRDRAAFWDSEMLYHSLVDCLPQSIAQGHRTIHLCQPTILSHGGPAAREILGKTDADFYPSELAAKYRDDDERVMDTLTVWMRLRRMSGPMRADVCPGDQTPAPTPAAR